MKAGVFFSILFCLVSSLRGDVTIQSLHESEGKSAAQTIYLATDRFRADMAEGSVIIYPSEDRMVVLMHPQKQYMEHSLSETMAMASYLPDVAAPAPRFERTGNRREISGFDCQEVVAFTENEGSTHFWMSPRSVPADKFIRIMDSMGASRQGGQQEMASWVQFFKQNPDLSTYPICVEEKSAEGVVRSVTTVQSIDQSDLPASTFQPPAGYSAMSMPGFATPSPEAAAGSVPAPPGMPSAAVLQELQKIQQEIQRGGGQATPAQMKRLQELAQQMQSGF